MTNLEWVNPDPEHICDICRMPQYEPEQRPADDWNEETGNHFSCEEFMGRPGR